MLRVRDNAPQHLIAPADAENRTPRPTMCRNVPIPSRFAQPIQVSDRVLGARKTDKVNLLVVHGLLQVLEINIGLARQCVKIAVVGNPWAANNCDPELRLRAKARSAFQACAVFPRYLKILQIWQDSQDRNPGFVFYDL